MPLAATTQAKTAPPSAGRCRRPRINRRGDRRDDRRDDRGDRREDRRDDRRD